MRTRGIRRLRDLEETIERLADMDLLQSTRAQQLEREGRALDAVFSPSLTVCDYSEVERLGTSTHRTRVSEAREQEGPGAVVAHEMSGGVTHDHMDNQTETSNNDNAGSVQRNADEGTGMPRKREMIRDCQDTERLLGARARTVLDKIVACIQSCMILSYLMERSTRLEEPRSES